MSLIRMVRWGIVLCALWGSAAWASCWQAHSPYEIDMSMGRVVVSPDLPVGGVIATRTWTMPSNNTVYVSCSESASRTFKADVVAPGMMLGGSNIYATDIPGIGLRFSRKGQISIVYPGTYTTTGSRFILAGSTFTLEIVKTAEVTGSGTLASGPYTEYGLPGIVMLKTSLTADAITIVSPSCSVLSGKNMNVDIGTIKRSDLKGVGTWAGNTPFNIQLRCSGGVSISGYANINTTFSGNLATGTTSRQGVLINEKTGSSAAKGIGVQVLQNDTPLEFNKKYNIGRLASDTTQLYSLPYRARFYQYLADTSSGEVESHMVFNLTYD